MSPASVGDDGVNPAVTRNDAIDLAADGRAVTDIKHRRLYPAASARDRLARCLQALRVHIEQHHGGAGAGQHFGHGQAQPAGSARHGRHLTRHTKQIF